MLSANQCLFLYTKNRATLEPTKATQNWEGACSDFPLSVPGTVWRTYLREEQEWSVQQERPHSVFIDRQPLLPNPTLCPINLSGTKMIKVASLTPGVWLVLGHLICARQGQRKSNRSARERLGPSLITMGYNSPWSPYTHGGAKIPSFPLSGASEVPPSEPPGAESPKSLPCPRTWGPRNNIFCRDGGLTILPRVVSNSWPPVILPLWPPKALGLQAWATSPDLLLHSLKPQMWYLPSRSICKTLNVRDTLHIICGKMTF